MESDLNTELLNRKALLREEVASQNLILGSDVHENCAGSSSSRFRERQGSSGS